MERAADGRMRTRVDECEAQLARVDSDRAEGIESRVRGVESTLEGEMAWALGITESLEGRVRAAERGRAAVDGRPASDPDDEAGGTVRPLRGRAPGVEGREPRGDGRGRSFQ